MYVTKRRPGTVICLRMRTKLAKRDISKHTHHRFLPKLFLRSHIL